MPAESVPRHGRQCYTCQQYVWLHDEEWNCDVCVQVIELQRHLRQVNWRPTYWHAILYQLIALNAFLRGLRHVND